MSKELQDALTKLVEALTSLVGVIEQKIAQQP